ncbi:MAG: helix-turn-helix domain-containing protein [Candidatus Cloacimonetes bacterium]|nr:helix-turn-helix domain-containing protein [Candidatus Cloacimonadota bacterium]MCB5286616.1 helix-turn-helix domain-containing protein [Candidatus Cloacimonadota bacterium]
MNAPVNAPVNLSDTQQNIIDKIMDNSSVSYDTLADILDLNRTTVMRNIQILKKAGILTRIGSDKTGYWQVNDEFKG